MEPGGLQSTGTRKLDTTEQLTDAYINMHMSVRGRRWLDVVSTVLRGSTVTPCIQEMQRALLGALMFKIFVHGLPHQYCWGDCS